MVNSVIMSEDGQFCAHHGIDFGELKGELSDLVDGKPIRGASTITMQTAKNLYLWHRPLGSLRKLIELPLAVYVDLVTPSARGIARGMVTSGSTTSSPRVASRA